MCVCVRTHRQLDVFTPTNTPPPPHSPPSPSPSTGAEQSPKPLRVGQSFVLYLWIIVKGVGGVGGLSVSLLLMKRTQRGVSPATQTMMVNMWLIKESWDVFVVL